MAIVSACLGLGACGDDTSGDSSASATGTTSTTAPGTDTVSTGTAPTSSGSASGGQTSSGGDSVSTSAADTTDGFIFDLGVSNDFGSVECGCGNTEFSYIWIANSTESTVSRLNTRTMVEEGRYITRPDKAGNPSRTSVSIDGRAVAVANRHGGLIKIWARPEDCVEKNGTPGIQTSTGKDNVLAWDQDECVAWYNPFADVSVQRPVAWTSGTLNPVTCVYEDQKVWTITGKGGNSPGICGPEGIFIHRVNGDDGTIEDTVHIPEAESQCQGSLLGAYGAAVDPQNDLWFHTWGGLVFVVRNATLTYEKVNTSSIYGITTDSKGRVWWGDSPRRYDPLTMLSESYTGDLPGVGGAGIAEDLKGRMWTATTGGIGWVDRDTLVAGDKVMLPEQTLHRGISVDIDGFIWAIPLNGTTAYKIDPDTYTWEVYDGLNGAYTYSDMTGGALTKAQCGVPQG